MNESEVMARAERARKFLESDVWQEAWTVYRERIVEAIDQADSSDTDKVMQLKRLMAASKAARTHLEALMIDGKVAAKHLELVQKKPFLKRFG